MWCSAGFRSFTTRTTTCPGRPASRDGCQRVDVAVGDDTLHLYNVHLGTAFLERRHQAGRLERHRARPSRRGAEGGAGRLQRMDAAAWPRRCSASGSRASTCAHTCAAAGRIPASFPSYISITFTTRVSVEVVKAGTAADAAVADGLRSSAAGGRTEVQFGKSMVSDRRRRVWATRQCSRPSGQPNAPDSLAWQLDRLSPLLRTLPLPSAENASAAGALLESRRPADPARAAASRTRSLLVDDDGHRAALDAHAKRQRQPQARRACVKPFNMMYGSYYSRAWISRSNCSLVAMPVCRFAMTPSRPMITDTGMPNSGPKASWTSSRPLPTSTG